MKNTIREKYGIELQIISYGKSNLYNSIVTSGGNGSLRLNKKLTALIEESS